MNVAMEMLRSRAQKLYDLVAGESNIELLIDPVEESESTALEATCQVGKCNVELSKAMTICSNLPLNPSFEHLKWTFERQGKLKVWIYNISRREYTLGNGMISNLKVPACPADAEYTVVTSIPAVVIQPKENVDNNTVDYVMFDGRRVAMDLINPSNLGLDQDTKVDPNRQFGIGTNFSNKGLFFSTHNPPLKKELRAAHKRMKAYYTDLMDRANIIRVIAAAPALGVSVAELKAAQEYVEDAVFNR